MRVLEIIGICLVALLAILFVIFFRRRLLMLGGGTIRVQVRTSTLYPGRGWSSGIGQFQGEEFRVYRMFSFALRPRRVLNRGVLRIESRREPEGPERLSMPGHWTILRCQSGTVEVEVAMAESTVTGFLSWLEAAPPGQAGRGPHPRIRPRTIEQ
ncbi:DUF2550 domain-containing protein [Actinoplanes sp. TBRC 11911]|uniref:DUF2550 domain-containing protein n=1 Tax=Actinoplanes sp. TBRC 11911 TaxID=2729386 RepID=UPI00145E45C7|nr:DUF2550 domain-containing protein [Actinoplanes sp. TBRC 11911]NMO56013.1 DUF2550 domain-containing protein [Actinoplanes sp. TBRC 11911]